MTLTTFTTLQATEISPSRAALLACAARCSELNISEWWSTYAVPFEELSAVVGQYASDADVDNDCPEAAAMFLLLVRETMQDAQATIQ